MGSRWPLDGLLRFRRLEQDQAEADLAEANHRLRSSEHAVNRARNNLAGYGDSAVTVEQLRAIAAARSTGAAMVQELNAVVKLDEADARAKAFEAERARRATKSLDKLHDRHLEAEHAADLRDEQAAIDEIAARNAGARKGNR